MWLCNLPFPLRLCIFLNYCVALPHFKKLSIIFSIMVISFLTSILYMPLRFYYYLLSPYKQLLRIFMFYFVLLLSYLGDEAISHLFTIRHYFIWEKDWDLISYFLKLSTSLNPFILLFCGSVSISPNLLLRRGPP